MSAGLDPHLPSLFLLEGVAVYLERAVLQALLQHLRQVAADGSTLAISLSVTAGTANQDARRAAFQVAVAAVGEPTRSVLEAAAVGAFLEAAGWRPAAAPELPGRAVRAGFLIATPADPTIAGPQPTPDASR